MEIITINGREYAPLDEITAEAPTMAQELEGMRYCMVRTYSAGVFAGYVQSLNGKEATLRKARRIWYWSGAASLSQLATDGTSDPGGCKFPCEVEEAYLSEVIEVIPITAKAEASIKAVPVWEE